MSLVGLIQEAEYRKTRKYVGNYAHLDEWDYLPFEWRVLSDKVTEDWGYDGAICHTLRIKVYGEATQDELREVLRDHFVKGCACEYDCCGHLHGGLSTLFKPSNRRKDEYIARVTYWPNY